VHFKVAKVVSPTARKSNPIIFSTCYLRFLYALILFEVEKLKRRKMLVSIFPIQLSLHLIISLEKPARILIYGRREYAGTVPYMVYDI
jgi:hypothetical protein